jgi:hypothetical protein
MAREGIAKVQHYVPEFLLRNFRADKKDQIYVFDKNTERSFRTNVRNVAAESRFYDFEFEGKTLTLETALSQLESQARPLFQRILDDDSLAVLNAEDRVLLAVFFSIQLARTRWFREHWPYLVMLLRDKVRSMVPSDEVLKSIEDTIRVPDQNQVSKEMAVFIMQASSELAIHFINKVWLLLRTERKRPFLISDNPLALQNMNNMRPFGNIGLAVRGIEIYFPLSPIRALALWCPSLGEMFQKAATNLRFFSQIAPHLVATLSHDPLFIEKTVAAMETGRPLTYEPENVLNLNSLQVHYAERHVFSCIDDFALVREMIERDPSIRSGPRGKVN